MLQKVVQMALITGLTPACSSTMDRESVTEIVSAQLDCPAAKIELKEVGNNWYAKGCGKNQAFVCSGSNFLSDGVCMKN